MFCDTTKSTAVTVTGMATTDTTSTRSIFSRKLAPQRCVAWQAGAMGKKDRKINKKKQHQQQTKGGKKGASAAFGSDGACRHRGQVSSSSCGKVRSVAACAVSGCDNEHELRVCLGCGFVACKVHAKRHWAKAQSMGHAVALLLDEDEEGKQVFCYECERFFSGPLEGEVSKAVELVRSGGDGEAEETSGDATVDVQISAKSKPGNGLTNLGNTCFMNSVLQCLAYLPPLTGGNWTVAGPLGSALLNTVAAIWSDSSKKRFSPSDLLKLVRATFSQFRRGTQEDAHELFRSLLDGVDEEFIRRKQNADSLVRRLFMLETTSVVTCHGCSTSFARREEAMDCSVEMASSSKRGKKKKREEEAAAALAEAEEQTDNKDDDDVSLSGPEEAEPDVTTLQLSSFLGKRFPIFLPEVMPMFLDQAPPPPPPPKTHQSVAAPTVVTRLDAVTGRYDARAEGAGKRSCVFLEAFTSPEVLCGKDKYHCSKCRGRRVASKQLLLGPRLPVVLAVHFKRFAQDASGQLFKITRGVEGFAAEIDVGGYCVDAGEGKSKYQLKGAVVHSGTSLRQGHYVAYCTFGAGKWVMISDTSVRGASLAEALSSEAYIAFYSQE